MTRKENTEWIPIQVEELDIIAHARRVKKWENDPSSDPELERWYRYGLPKGLPFEVAKPMQVEIDYEKYYLKYMEATNLEKQGEITKALNIYLSILESYTPLGTSYYESPIYLLENKGDYQTAIKICDRAIREIEKKSFNANVTLFLDLKKRMENKLERYGPDIFNARLEVLLNKIKTTPGINKKNLESFLSDYENWSYGEVISVTAYALEKELIQRVKQGRAYSYSVN